MRILQLASAFAYTGPAEPMLQLAVDLAARGHDVTVGHDTVRPMGNVHEEGIGPRVVATGLPVASELALCTRSGPLTWLRDRSRLRKRLRGVDVVHVHFSHDHALAALARPPGVALVRTVHSDRSLRPRVGQRWLLHQSDALLVHSETARRQAVALGIPEPRVHVVHGAVDTTRFHPSDADARRARFRSEHGLHPTAPALLMVAIFQAGRGQPWVLEQWPAIRARVPDAQLWFVGLGEERDALMHQVQQRSDEGVRFLGYLTATLADAYLAADASVLLRVGNDGYGRAALESLACGTPVITSVSAAAVADVVHTSGAGRVVPDGDVNAFVSAAVELLERRDPALRPRAVAAVEQHHTRRSVTSQAEAVYAAVLQHRRGRLLDR